MSFDKNFWIAIAFFIMSALAIGSWIRDGFTSYLASASILGLIIGGAFLRRAIKNGK